MESWLHDYHDKEIVKYLKFGWPINAGNITKQEEMPRNQKSIDENELKILQYLKSELEAGSVVGPFLTNPCGPEARFSPLGAVPKKDNPEEMRIILNLSFPFLEGSVNHSIPDNTYFNKEINLKYPGVDHLVKLIWKKGKGCKIFKRDLKKAYRQIFIDVGSAHWVGFSFQGMIFFDLSLSMGLKVSAYICQRITSSIIFIYEKRGFSGLNYLDDLGGAEVERKAQEAFDSLGAILSSLRIEESMQKAFSHI